MRVCTKCKVRKPETCFDQRKDGKGLKSRCAICAHKKFRGNYYSKSDFDLVWEPKKVVSSEQKRANKAAYARERATRPEAKAAHACRQRLREAGKANATPSWLSQHQLDNIAQYYLMARKLTDAYGVALDVDHIEPLRGKDVCGLHVPWNLQILEHKTNLKKGNRRGI